MTKMLKKFHFLIIMKVKEVNVMNKLYENIRNRRKELNLDLT